MPDPATSPSPSNNHQRTVIDLPGVTTEEVRGWAQNVIEANPIASGGSSDPRFPAGASLEITDEPFMGVELTFVAMGRAVHTLVLFAEAASEEERATMLAAS